MLTYIEAPVNNEIHNNYLFFTAFTSSFVQVNVSLLEDNVGETSTTTLDGSQGKHDLTFSVDVGGHHTENVLEFLWDYERLKKARDNGLTDYL